MVRAGAGGYRLWLGRVAARHQQARLDYAAHNFIVVSGKKSFGLFIDFPARIRWDLGYTSADKAEITVEGEDFAVYLIDGEQPREIIRTFRAAIGKSYLPPKWAFGYQQSRWST